MALAATDAFGLGTRSSRVSQWPSCQGLIDGSDPPGRVGVGVHIPTLPDADRGIPKWGVAPVHGLEARIGIAAPMAVAQPQTVQQLAESVPCTSETRFPAHRLRCHMCASGSASGASKTAFKSQLRARRSSRSGSAGRRLVSALISGRMPRASDTSFWRLRLLSVKFLECRSCSPSSKGIE